MPELPEVERVRLTLVPRLVGRRCTRVELRRRDIWTPVPGTRPTAAEIRAQLLEGATIDRLERRGKQLAIIAKDGRVLCVHLGMSGQLTYAPARLSRLATHTHARWSLADHADHADHTGPAGELIFRDPRRFGGLWSLASTDQLESRWAELGPDALETTAKHLARALATSHRPVKSALLDQSVVAGVGNIYADESLFRARIDPRELCDRLTAADWSRLARHIRAVLRAAVDAGGSTLRDYVDGDGSPGQGKLIHLVYGRGGMPCFSCGQTLRSITLAQRTTVFCANCQRRSSAAPRNSRHFSTRARRPRRKA